MELTAYELLWLFLTYSFLGWCLEVSLAAVKRRRLINKGFLNAPFCVLYGTAAVAFALFLPELQESLFFLFLRRDADRLLLRILDGADHGMDLPPQMVGLLGK